MVMLCKNTKNLNLNDYHLKGWIAQEKKDGVRCLYVNGRLFGRSGKEITNQFPEILENLKFDGILDGEIVCDKFEYVLSRVQTQNKLKSKVLAKKYPSKYFIFDILKKNEYDYKNLALNLRLKALLDIKKEISNKFIYVLENSTDLIGFREKCKNMDCEGIILKEIFSTYEDKRSSKWLKVKFVKSKDIKFTSYIDNPAGIRVESDDEIAIQVSGSDSVFVRNQINQKGYCDIEVEYLNETDSGKLRMPVKKRILDGMV